MTPALLLAALTATAEPPQGAHMAPTCFPTLAEMTGFLAEWSEAPTFTGETFDEGSVRIFTGPDSWSLVATFDGLTCIVDQGEHWNRGL